MAVRFGLSAHSLHSLKDDSRLGHGQSAGAAGLDQVLVLVVVDVEVVKERHSTALISTDSVVGQVDDDALKGVDVLRPRASGFRTEGW